MFSTPVIFYGADYETALAKAKESARELLGKDVGHPDFFEIIPDGKNYTKEQITDFLQEVALAPYQAAHKVYLFHRADQMLPVHANALLKTFEEKPTHAVILLVTDNIKAIIETILSRSKKIFVQKGENLSSPVDEIVKKALLAATQKDLYTCLDIIPELENANLEEVIDAIYSYAHEFHLPLESLTAWTEKAHIAQDRYMRPKLILEYLLAQLVIVNSLKQS